MDYQEEKKMLVDIARASINANGPFSAGETAPVVSVFYYGEEEEEKILDLFIGEDSGEVIVYSWSVAEERDIISSLAEFSNDEIRAILKATGIKVAGE